MYLLDTNVISELRKGNKAHPVVIDWIKRCPIHHQFVSAISLMELEIGILAMQRRDQIQGRQLRAWFEEKVLPVFKARVLPVDTSVALRCAKLHSPNPRSERDALIAATAAVHGMTVATRNVKDFALPGIDVVNPWRTP